MKRHIATGEVFVDLGVPGNGSQPLALLLDVRLRSSLATSIDLLIATGSEVKKMIPMTRPIYEDIE